MKIKLLILVTMMFFSCQKENGVLKESQISEVQQKVYKEGDKMSYSQLCLYYDDKKDNLSILPYSMIMAHRFNDKDAYYNVYRTTIMMFNNGEFRPDLIKKLDAQTKDFAFQHLLKSSKLGSSHANEILLEYENISK